VTFTVRTRFLPARPLFRGKVAPGCAKRAGRSFKNVRDLRLPWVRIDNKDLLLKPGHGPPTCNSLRKAKKGGRADDPRTWPLAFSQAAGREKREPKNCCAQEQKPERLPESGARATRPRRGVVAGAGR